jgi:hypothetical protein
MEFQEYAAREVSTLIDRIVSDAESRARTLIDATRQEHEAAMELLRSQLAAQALESEARLHEKEQLAADVQETRSQLEDLRRQFEAQETELQTLCHDVALQRSLAVTNTSATQELAQTRAALEDSQAEAQRLTRQFENALDELRNEHVSTLQQQAVARTVLPLDELLTMFDALASASSTSAVLTTIVSGLSREFSRVALFRVRAGRLECVKHVGFDFEGDIAKVVIPASLDCLMTRAVNAKLTQTFVAGGSQEPCAVPFGGTPACAVALPLISGDASVAVVYADDSDPLEFESVPSELLVKFADLVWRHAVVVLQRMSAAQKMLAISTAQGFERRA